MSLYRLVYYSALIGGWAAFLGWLLAEAVLLRGDANNAARWSVLLTGATIGATIGAGLNVVAGLSGFNLQRLLTRSLWGIGVGLLGGFLGMLLGNGLFALGLPRALGFTVLGVGVGLAEGLCDHSLSKTRNGAIGGLLGGFAGGLLFDPLQWLLNSSSGIASRATAFVVLGLAIGALVGLVQVVLKEAWLTVLDGYRPGRQHILSQPVTSLGRADHLPLAFIGPMNQNLEPVHCRIIRQADGQYAVEDNQSHVGLSVNHTTVLGTRRLRDGDVIKIGTNFVRFNERRRSVGQSSATEQTQQSAVPTSKAAKAPPPPPPPGKSKVAATAGSAVPTPVAKPQPTSIPLVKPAIPPKPASGSTTTRSTLPPPPPPPAKKKT
jgi:pSer/pThr/pTyr-binding forkhead associated (FHA) protein